jgi:hypothetical protein
MTPFELVSRSWNGTPIHRRTTDGYVNATAMCKANGKQWSKYREADRCQEYIDALAETSDFGGLNLIETRAGNGGGTWIHPRLAVDLARWISAPFAVWMDRWFLENIQQASEAPVETVSPRLREVEMITLIESSLNLFDRLGGMDQRDEILFKDVVRNNLLAATSGSLPQIDPELALSDAWLEVFQQPLNPANFNKIGKLVARNYRKEFNEDPPLREQFVNGRPCQVKSYRRSWLLRTLEQLNLVSILKPSV